MTKLKSILAIAFFSITAIASAQTADDRSLFDVTGNVKSITSKSDTGPLSLIIDARQSHSPKPEP